MLAKNDKIIIVVGVVILLVAAAAVALYTQPDETPDDFDSNGDSDKYLVEWVTSSDEYSSQTYNAGHNAPYVETIEIPEENIMKVTFEISWTDDRTTGLLFPRFQDTLTIDIEHEDGTTKSETSTGNGTFEIVFDNINPIPSSTTVEDQSEIYDMYSTDSPVFDVTVSVTKGEKIRRPLKYLMDKGNDFDMTIIYEYYTEEITQQNSDGNSDDDNGGDDDTTTGYDYTDFRHSSLGRTFI